MKNSPRRILASAVAAALVFAVLGCGGGADARKADPPTFAVDDSVRPSVAEIDDEHGKHPVGAVRDSQGNVTSFVSNELIVRLPAGGDESAMLDRLGGTVLQRSVLPGPLGGGTLLLVRVDTAKGDVDRLPANAHQVNPGVGGQYAVSSQQALQLLALAFQSRVKDGLSANVNALGAPAGFVDDLVARSLHESSSLSPANVFEWPYLREGGAQDIGVTEAWRNLALAGKITEQPQPLVKIAIMDAGFSNSADLPRRTVINGSFDSSGRTLPNTAGCSTGAGCDWHGVEVSHVMAAIPGNAMGVAGPAGPVADLILLQSPTDVLTFVSYLFALPAMLATGPRIINISAEFELPALLFPVANLVSDLTTAIRDLGTLIFAAAGNHSKDVDMTQCVAGVCWELSITMPCELARVTCVGGLAHDSSAPDPETNFGAANGGLDGQGVDIYGPYRAFAPASDLSSISLRGGTSLSAPFAAGVAALIWAADLSRSADDVERILYTTAHHGTTGPNSYIWVDANAAVQAALGSICEPPTAQILQPEPNAVVAVGDPITFRGFGSDRGAELPGTAMTWSVNGTTVGTGATLQHTFPSPGTHRVTLTMRGCSAVPATRTMTVTARQVNTPPGTVTILYPGNNAILPATGVQDGIGFVDVNLSGAARYADGSTVPSDRLRWRSSAETQTWQGAHPVATLHSGNCVNADHVLTLEAFTAGGASIGTATVHITVQNAPC